jgi:penicillin-binding protein 1A
VFLALRLERELTKDEILYLYLNQIYLGAGAYGVQAAAQVYFDKDVSELSLAEAPSWPGCRKRPVATRRGETWSARKRASDTSSARW